MTGAILGTILFFGILIAIAAIKGNKEAEDKRIYLSTGKCPRCKNDKFQDATVQHQLKGTTSRTDMLKVCQRCGCKIKISTSLF